MPIHPPEVLHRAGAPRCVRALLRLGLRGPQLPDDRQRQEPLPVSRRGRPLRRDLSLPDPRPDDSVNDTFNIGAKVFTTMKRGLPGRARRGGVRQAYASASRQTPADLGLALPGSTAARPPLYKWVYETASKHDSFVSIEKAERQLGYRAPVHQQGRTAAQLPLVRRPPRTQSRASPASRTACRGSRACWPWPSGSSDARHPAQRSGVDRGARAGRREERRAFP